MESLNETTTTVPIIVPFWGSNSDDYFGSYSLLCYLKEESMGAPSLPTLRPSEHRRVRVCNCNAIAPHK